MVDSFFHTARCFKRMGGWICTYVLERRAILRCLLDPWWFSFFSKKKRLSFFLRDPIWRPLHDMRLFSSGHFWFVLDVVVVIGIVKWNKFGSSLKMGSSGQTRALQLGSALLSQVWKTLSEFTPPFWCALPKDKALKLLQPDSHINHFTDPLTPFPWRRKRRSVLSPCLLPLPRKINLSQLRRGSTRKRSIYSASDRTFPFSHPEYKKVEKVRDWREVVCRQVF